LRFSFIKDRRLQTTVFYGGCASRMSSGRANLAAEATGLQAVENSL